MTLFNDETQLNPRQLLKCAMGLYNAGIISISQVKTLKSKIEIKYCVELGTSGIDFKVFWDLFDKKVGDMEAAKKSWNLLSPTLQKKIIDLLPNWKAQFKGKQFQPNPETFINGKRWNDEIIIAEQAKKDVNSNVDIPQSKSEAAFNSHDNYMTSLYGTDWNNQNR